MREMGSRIIRRFGLRPEDFSFVGRDLQRPECVLGLRDGSVLASDKSALVSRILPAGTTIRHGTGALLSNTMALDDFGGLVIADVKRGAILSANASGYAVLLHDSFDGSPLGSVNFVMASDDEEGVWWFSVSTREADFRAAINRPRPDGRIFRLTSGGLDLAADGLHFPNAMQIDPQRGFLYVAETTAGAVSRAKIHPGGRLGSFEALGPRPLYPQAYTDGLALDEEGNVWVTELSRNAIIVIGVDGQHRTIFEDPNGKVLNKPTGLAFGGPDLRSVFVGSLKMSTLPTFRSPIPGMLTRHWRRGTQLAVSQLPVAAA